MHLSHSTKPVCGSDRNPLSQRFERETHVVLHHFRHPPAIPIVVNIHATAILITVRLSFVQLFAQLYPILCYGDSQVRNSVAVFVHQLPILRHVLIFVVDEVAYAQPLQVNICGFLGELQVRLLVGVRRAVSVEVG